MISNLLKIDGKGEMKGSFTNYCVMVVFVVLIVKFGKLTCIETDDKLSLFLLEKWILGVARSFGGAKDLSFQLKAVVEQSWIENGRRDFLKREIYIFTMKLTLINSNIN